MAKPEIITADQVRKLLSYDPETGVFRWKMRDDASAQWNGRYAGTVAGYVNHHGHRQINLFGKMRQAHRLAWLMMTDEWPIVEVDHENLCGSDNRWLNLRLATHSQNCANVHVRNHSKTGIKGVQKRGDRFIALLTVDKKQNYLGTFNTLEAAHAAYVKAAAERHGKFARTA